MFLIFIYGSVMFWPLEFIWGGNKNRKVLTQLTLSFVSKAFREDAVSFVDIEEQVHNSVKANQAV